MVTEKAKVSLDEQELTINYFPRQATDRMNVYSCIPKEIKYLLKLAELYPEDVKILQNDKYGVNVEIPGVWFRRPKPPTKRIMNAEQRAVAAERMRAIQAAKKGGSNNEQGDPD